MLIGFAVTNYRGFKQRIEWNLTHPNNYFFHADAVQEGIVKNGIIYGSNGSGKTNFGLAIFDIANHLSHKWKKPDYYLNYACAGHQELPVEFEYTFALGGHTLLYNYSKVASELKGNIVREQLIVDGREVLLKDIDVLNIANEFGLTQAAVANLKESANNISIVNYLLSSVSLPTGHVLLLLRDFVEHMLLFTSMDSREFVSLKDGGSELDEYIISHNLSDEFAVFLTEVSGQTYTFAPITQGGDRLFCLMGGQTIPFQWVASTGIKNLELQYCWLKEMANASFVFIDHHELSYPICKRLFEGKYQVFVTASDPFLLRNDLLLPDCIFILSDNKIKAICDMIDQ